MGLRGGWAVDLHAGAVTREHDDIDIAVWLADEARVAALLVAEGWTQRADQGGDGYTVYDHGGVRLELAFLARGDDGEVYTPITEGRAPWPPGAFADDVGEAAGVRARVIALPALRAEKAETRDDPRVAANDRADPVTLGRLG